MRNSKFERMFFCVLREAFSSKFVARSALMQLAPVSSKTVQHQLVQNSFFGDLIGSYEKSDGGNFENKMVALGVD